MIEKSLFGTLQLFTSSAFCRFVKEENNKQNIVFATVHEISIKSFRTIVDGLTDRQTDRQTEE
jgi:hypothetical protein